MKALKLTIILLCVGLLGLTGIVASLPRSSVPRPGPPSPTEQQAALAPATQNVEPVRAAVGAPLNQARNLAAAGPYTRALARVDSLEAVPNTSDSEMQAIAQMRQYLLITQDRAVRNIPSR